MELDLAESPNDPTVLLRASNSYSAQARILNAKGQFKEGLAKFKRSAEIREDLLKRTPSDASALRNMMISYGHLGDSHNAPGVPELKDADAAKAYYLKAVAIAERLVKADKVDIRSKYDLGNALSRLGSILSRAQDHAESMAVLQRAVDAFEEVRKSDPSVLVYSADLATVLITRGDRYGEASKIEDAKSSYERSVALSDWVLSKDKTAIRSDATVFIALKKMALLKASIGDRNGALDAADSLLSRARQMSPDQRVRNGRFEPLAYYWQGSVYEILARQNQSASRLADWKSAQEAYRMSEAGWLKLTDVQILLSRPRSCDTLPARFSNQQALTRIDFGGPVFRT